MFFVFDRIENIFSFSHNVSSLLSRLINPFPNKPWFLRVCSISLLKIMREKEKLLIMSNFSFSHSVFYPLRELSAIFMLFKIVVCKFFQFGILQNLSFGKGLNYRICLLTLSQTTNFRPFQISKTLQTKILNSMKSSPNGLKTLGEKEKLLVTSNFSFSHSVFKRLVLQTGINQGLFGTGLKG